MEQHLLPKEEQQKERCDAPSCRQCPQCKVIDLEERMAELKVNASQLYGKEAENYFFYYALNIKQSS